MKSAKTFLVALAIVTLGVLAQGLSPAFSAESDKAEIAELNQRLTYAFSRRDIDAVMAFYTRQRRGLFRRRNSISD
jgi:hypothetical protein